MAFRGLYEHSLDSKDRLTVPSRFRSQLADGVVLSKGFDPCVWVHTTAEFEELSDRFLSPHSPFGKDARALRRRFHGGSFDEKLDSAGRIRIPKPPSASPALPPRRPAARYSSDPTSLQDFPRYKAKESAQTWSTWIWE